MRHSIWRVCFFGIVALIVILYPMIFRNPFYQHLAILTFLYALVATGWNVLGGLAGQVSFGHAVFFGAGAYTVTLIQAKFHLSPWVGLLAGVVLAVVLGLMIGYPTLGLRGRYFTIATMVLGEIAALLVMNTPAIGGAAGMYVPVAAQGLANFQWHTSKVPYYYATLLLLVIALVAVDFLRKSKCGYYLRALGAQPDAAEAIGIDIRRYKIIACCVSAVIAAIGGAFYANYVLFVDPDSVLPMAKSTMFVVITLVGGIGTLWGPLLGALVIIPASEITRVMLSGSGRALDLIVYGAILVLTTLFAPKGIMGIVERIAGKLKSIRPC